MAIVETRIAKRTNTSVQFFSETSAATAYDGVSVINNLITSGNVTRETTVSDDGLTQTRVYTIDSLDTWAQLDNASGIDFDAMRNEYLENSSFPTYRDASFVPCTVTGIDSPFTATIVYTFPTPDISMEIFANSLSLLPGFTVTVGSNTVTVTRQFADSNDYTANYLQDLVYAQQLHAKGVTRVYTYTAV